MASDDKHHDHPPHQHDDHAHGELKENLASLRKFWDDWGVKILIATLIVVAAWSGRKLYQGWRQKAQQEVRATVEGRESGAQFEAAASTLDDVNRKAYAYLMAGHMFMNESQVGEEGEQPSADVREKKIEKALEMYNQVLDLEKALRVYHLAAHNALAVYYENEATRVRQIDRTAADKLWNQAEAHYQALADADETAHAFYHVLGKDRLAKLEISRRPLVFAPSPEAGDDDDGTGLNLPEIPSDMGGGGLDLPMPPVMPTDDDDDDTTDPLDDLPGTDTPTPDDDAP